MHPRRKIRDFVGAALDASQKIAPVVAIGEVLPVSTADLPSVQVYTGREHVELLYSESPRVEQRIVDLRVELLTHATTGQRAQDLLDELAEAVVEVVLDDETHGDIAEKTEYRESLPSAVADGDRNIVGLIVGFDVTYSFEYTQRELDDLERIAALDDGTHGIDIESETADQIEAEIDLEIPTS